MAIVGTKRTMVDTLRESVFEFHPTGSQVFGEMNKDSDLDFFVEDSEQVREWLVANGFRHHTTGYEDDPQIATVYRFNDEKEIIIWEEPTIDVQLIVEIDKKVKVQNALVKFNTFQGITSKVSKRRIWKAMYELLK